MIKFQRMKDTEKKDIYRIVSNELGMNEAILEKDYWVFLMLDIIFTKSRFKEAFAFKGGTSLSKAYHQIKRFSEDIDLVLDWRILGYEKQEPWAERSKTKQRKFNEEMNERTSKWLKSDLLPELNHILKILEVPEIKLEISPIDPQTVQVFYPNMFSDTSVLQEIRLEIGSLAAWTPIENREISAYIMTEFGTLFPNNKIYVPTVEAKRTFWEKITILHKEAHRVKTQVPGRYSRHYYDVYELASSEVKNAAFADLDLLKKVVDFKAKFYADNAAKYEKAVPGKIKLLPNANQVEMLLTDYELMKNMMFGESPSFNAILEKLQELEAEINSLQ